MLGIDRVPRLYLDTSFLSQFANAEMGKLGESSNAEKWGVLLARLRHEVQRGTLICPASQFPMQEALLSSKILPQFRRVQSELSGGYFFKDWMDILVHQAADQVLVYLERPQDRNLGWSVLAEQILPISTPPSTRKSKEKVKQYAERLRKEKPPENSYDKQYEAERNAFMWGERRRYYVPWDFFQMLIREASLSQNELPKMLDFFRSELVDQIPFIHIFCSIYASLRFYERTRRSKDGDWLDVAALASAMPYCSIVTTDKSMREHIEKRLHFHTDYEADIFTPTAKSLDALLERLEAFTQ